MNINTTQKTAAIESPGVSISEHQGQHIKAKKKQLPRQPNCQGRKGEGRKCYECGTMLLKAETYIVDWINQDLQALCMDCYIGRR